MRTRGQVQVQSFLISLRDVTALVRNGVSFSLPESAVNRRCHRKASFAPCGELLSCRVHLTHPSEGDGETFHLERGKVLRIGDHGSAGQSVPVQPTRVGPGYPDHERCQSVRQDAGRGWWGVCVWVWPLHCTALTLAATLAPATPAACFPRRQDAVQLRGGVCVWVGARVCVCVRALLLLEAPRGPPSPHSPVSPLSCPFPAFATTSVPVQHRHLNTTTSHPQHRHLTP